MAVAEEIKPRFVDELITKSMQLNESCQTEHARRAIDSNVEAAMRQYTVAGIDVAPADARKKLTEEYERRYDEVVQASLVQFDEEIAATKRDLEARIEKSRQPAMVRDDARELVLYQRWAGRSLGDFVDWYERTTDADEPVVAMLVEEDDAARLFRLTLPETSAAAAALASRFTAARRARQDARQDATAMDHLRVLLETVESSVFMNELRREARQHQGRPEDFRIARNTRITRTL